jgi:hypothetical protein
MMRSSLMPIPTAPKVSMCSGQTTERQSSLRRLHFTDRSGTGVRQSLRHLFPGESNER